MRKVLGIIRYTFIEIFRNKVYYVLLLFAGLIILSTLLLGDLGGEQRARMIIDLGLAAIEAFSLVISVFAAVTLVLEEMETRTLYLILTRPVARYQFILGRFLGLLAIMTVAFGLMAAGHSILLKILHIAVDRHYLLSLYYSWEKIVVITAVAMVFSLFSTSTLSAVTFTFFFWVLGHFSGEIRFLAEKASQPMVTWACKTVYYLAPNFEAMNIHDFPLNTLTPGWLWAAIGYGFIYTGACLFLTVLLFRNKEF